MFVGKSEDTNFHIIDRDILVFIAVTFVTIIYRLEFKVKLYNYILTYVAAVSLATPKTWISGFFVELHIHDYIDIFLNFTAVYITFAVVFAIVQHFRSRKITDC